MSTRYIFSLRTGFCILILIIIQVSVDFEHKFLLRIISLTSLIRKTVYRIKVKFNYQFENFEIKECLFKIEIDQIHTTAQFTGEHCLKEARAAQVFIHLIKGFFISEM